MTGAADRHLLFGLLALQNGIINQVQLVAAFQAWTLDKSRSLAHHLEARGDLDADDRSAVEALVARHVKKHGGDVERSLASIATHRSTRVKLASLSDPQVEASLACVASGQLSTEHDDDVDPNVTIVGTATSDGQRFRVLRPHARGGLGAVFVALDTELHREVALKQILDALADDAVSRQRFLLEAEVTGGLEHPGIVPVYGLGTYGNGRPFYTMRFIRGDSLREAIERFHTNEELKSDPGRRSLELRELLRRFLDVCNAIDYAHSRGVLHRDIKPSNIIVGKHGETLVVDWGLAKPLGRIEVGSDAGERTLIPSSTSGSAETLPGSALGTPAYMSPEQAAGDLENLGPRSDVYSLGATLFCLLTGKPPFEDDDLGAMLRDVQRGVIRPMRQLDPTIDRALEAVCQKAMALNPDDRYAIPKALAEDVDRWMADEPVAAFSERWGRRVFRWMRRHRTWAQAAVFTLLVVTVGAVAASVVVERARRSERRSLLRLRDSLAAERDAKAEAHRNFDQARRAVDDYLTTISESRELKRDLPGLQPLRERLLRKALTYYQAFLTQRTDDPALRSSVAEAYDRVARIVAEVGSKEEALTACRATLSLYQALVADRADTPGKRSLASSYALLGRLLTDLGATAEANGSLQQARELQEAILAVAPSAEVREDLARTLTDLGWLHDRAGRVNEAADVLRAARDHRLELLKANPDPRNRSNLADIDVRLGLIQDRIGRPDQARRSIEQAMGIYEGLVRDHPGDPDYRADLADSLFHLGAMLDEAGSPKDALPLLLRARGHWDELVTANPAVSRLQNSLANSDNSLGIVQFRLGKRSDAHASHGRARDRWEQLVRANPKVVDYKNRLAAAYNRIGLLHSTEGHLDKALEALQRSRSLREELAAAEPSNARIRSDLIRAICNIGALQLDLGRPTEALPIIQKAVVMQEELVRSHRPITRYPYDLANYLTSLGQAQRQTGSPALALDSYRRACSILESLPQLAPEDRYNIACYFAIQADLARQPGVQADPEALSDRAMVALRQAVRAGYRDPSNLEKDADLNALRSRPDFRLMMMELITPDDPFTPSR